MTINNLVDFTIVKAELEKQETIAWIAHELKNHFDQRAPGFGYTEEGFIEAMQPLLEDHSKTSADDLARLAEALVPGTTDDWGMLIRLVRGHLAGASPELLAAALLLAWQCGKGGHTFLPEPSSVPRDMYDCATDELLSWFDCTQGNPRRLLTNVDARDLDFFDSLPDYVTVYRGCFGITPKLAAAGVCWTTSRETAQWFAQRGRNVGAPVVVSARIRKHSIFAAFAAEHEVVCRPAAYNPIAIRGLIETCPPSWPE